MDATIKIGTMKVDDSFEIINKLQKSPVDKVGHSRLPNRLIEPIEEKINYFIHHRFELNSECFRKHRQLPSETAPIIGQAPRDILRIRLETAFTYIHNQLMTYCLEI